MTSIHILILLLITYTQSSILKDLRENLLPFTKKEHDGAIKKAHVKYQSHYDVPSAFKKNQDLMDVKLAKHKAKVIEAARKRKKEVETGVLSNAIKSHEKEQYQLDTLLNILKRKSFRRKRYSSSETSSSSLELKNWKDEWKEHWLQKKFEALNSSRPKGDTVNMVAARPWGQPCGDPNQHDMAWGTCMLPMECDAEFRIFRGDRFCGRTQFVCCALQLTTYDMYQGFDVSFADTSLATDSEEKRNRNMGSKERRRRKKRRDRKKRRRDRIKRKRKIKRTIRKIVREIRRILNRHYRNGTTAKKKRTRKLKKFVKDLKKKFKEERRLVKDIHEMDLLKVDAAIQERLNQIKSLNKEFMKNGTFRDVIVNGTNKVLGLRAQSPDLASRLPSARRRGVKRPKDYLDYDIEYGYLYY